VYPQVADRQTPDGWAEDGSLDMLARARDKAREILAGPPTVHLDPAVDAMLRSRYDIMLPAQTIGTGSND